MPFNTETAALAGSKGGKRSKRPKDPDTRQRSMCIKVTDAEYEAISAKAATFGVTKAELVVQAVRVYMAALAHDACHI